MIWHNSSNFPTFRLYFSSNFTVGYDFIDQSWCLRRNRDLITTYAAIPPRHLRLRLHRSISILQPEFPSLPNTREPSKTNINLTDTSTQYSNLKIKILRPKKFRSWNSNFPETPKTRYQQYLFDISNYDFIDLSQFRNQNFSVSQTRTNLPRGTLT